MRSLRITLAFVAALAATAVAAASAGDVKRYMKMRKM